MASSMLQRLHDRRKKPESFTLKTIIIGTLDWSEVHLHEIGTDHLLVSHIQEPDQPFMLMLDKIVLIGIVEK